MKKMDSQVVELLGRNRLVSDLLRAGLEVALPVRDRGIDLIAYADLSANVQRFSARPIQMKAALDSSFSVDQKYSKIRDLLYVYVWYLNEPERAAVYALTYDQAVQIAEKMGYTGTPSWKKGSYATTKPSKKLVRLLEPFLMDKGRWWRVLVGHEQN